MSRSYTLDNWDGGQSTSYTHRSPQTAQDTQASTSQLLDPFSFTDAELGESVTSLYNISEFIVGIERNDHLPSANFNGTISQNNENTSSISIEGQSILSVIDHDGLLPGIFVNSLLAVDDAVNTTDALNTSPQQKEQYESLSHSVSETTTRPLSIPLSVVKSEASAPSPILTVESRSTYTADADGEEDDGEVIILEHTSSYLPAEVIEQQNDNQDPCYDYLFTPPPSEFSESEPPSPTKRSQTRLVISPLPRPPRTIMSHVLVPPLLRPKSDYVRLSSLVKPSVKKRPRKTAEDGLRRALEAAWQNNQSEPNSFEDEPSSKKKKKRKRRVDVPNDPEPSGSRLPRKEHDAIVVKRPVKRTRVSGDNEFQPSVRSKKRPRHVIDLTLDSSSENVDERKSTPILPQQQLESRLTINVVDAIPYTALVWNICGGGRSAGFEEMKSMAWLHSDVAEWLLPLRKRRALVDEPYEMKVDDGEISLGGLVAPIRDPFSEDISDIESVVGQLDPSSGSSEQLDLSISTAPAVVEESSVTYPKIDFTAKIRKKRIAAKRVSTTLPSDGATPSAGTTSRPTTQSSPIKAPSVNDVDPSTVRTPDFPSAKALGKRKAVEPPELRFRSDLASLLPSALISPDRRAQLPPDENNNNMDVYINYWPSPAAMRSPTHPHNPTSLTFDNLPLPGTEAYPNPIHTMNVLEGQHHPETAFPNTYGEATTNAGYFPDNLLGGQQLVDSGLLRPWSPETDRATSYFSFDTVDPSLLEGGDLILPSEYPESVPITVVTETSVQAEETPVEPEKPRAVSPAISTTSSASIPLSQTVVQQQPIKVDDPDTIVVRHKKRPRPIEISQPLPRRKTKRHIPVDMVPLSDVDFSSSHSPSPRSSDSSDDESSEKSVIVSRPRVRRKTRERAPKRRSTPPSEEEDPTGKVMVGGKLWPMQEIPAYCHQCRNRTQVLKLTCPDCPKIYCVRCLTVRYPDDSRALQMRKVGCPDCLEYCNCTACCKKRGVEYVSTKAAAEAGDPSLLTRSCRARSRDITSSASGSPASLSASPPPDFSVPVSLGTSFGAIYGFDGARIGATVTRSAELGDREDSTSPPVMTPTTEERVDKKRVFVGKVHPSWRLGSKVKIVEVDPLPRPKKVHRYRAPRMYVGKRAPLFYKNEHVARELADLSPLSSVEEDWNDHDDKESVCGLELGSEQPECEGVARLEDSPFAPESLTDQDVIRAIGLSLTACGIQSNAPAMPS